MSSGMVCAGIVVAGTRDRIHGIDSWISSGIAGTSTAGWVKGPISTIFVDVEQPTCRDVVRRWMGPRLRVSVEVRRVPPAMSMLKEATSPWWSPGPQPRC